MDPWLYNNRQTVDYPQFLQLVQQQAATNPIIQYNNEQRTQPALASANFTPKPAHLPLNCNWQQTSETNQIRSSFEPYQTIAGGNQIFTNPSYSIQQTLNLAAAAQAKSEGGGNNPNSPYRQTAVAGSSNLVDSAAQSAANKHTVSNQSSEGSSPNTNQIKTENMYNINRNFDKSRIVNPANAGNAETNFEVPFTPAKAYNPQSQFFLIQEQERKATETRQEHEPLYLYRTTPTAMTIFNTARNLLAGNNATDRIKIEAPPYAGNMVQNDVSNAVVITRRPSPAQSNNSQISSPVYPPYNSPMNSVESPSQNSTGSSQPSDSAGHIVIYKTNQQQAHQQTAVSSPIVYPYPVITHNPRTHDPYSAAAANINIKPQPPTYNNNAHSTQIGALHNAQKEVATNQVTENIVVSTQCPLASQIQLTSKANNQQQQHQQVTVETVASSAQNVTPARSTPTAKGRRRKTPLSKAQQQAQQQQAQQQQQQQQVAQQLNQQHPNGVTQTANNTPLQLFSNQLNFANNQLQKQQQQQQQQQQQAMMNALCMPYSIQMSDIQIQQPGQANSKDSSNDNQAIAAAAAVAAPEEELVEEEPKPKVVLQSIEEEFPELDIKLPKPEKMQANANGATFIDSYLKFLDEQSAPPQQPQATGGGGRKGSQKPIVTSVQVVSNPATAANANQNSGGSETAQTDELQTQPTETFEVKKTSKWRRKKPAASNTAAANAANTNSNIMNNACNAAPTVNTSTSYDTDQSDQHQQQQQQQQEQVYRSPLPKKACPQIATQMSTTSSSSSYSTSPFQQHPQQQQQQQQNPQVNTQQQQQMQMQPSHPWSNLNPGNSMMNMQNTFQQQSQYATTTTTQNNVALTLSTSHPPQQYRHHLQEDPLNVPVRRETTVRKAKGRDIEDLMCPASDNDEEAFADSDTDPVWTPQEEEDEDEPRQSKRKQRKPKPTSRCKQRANILSAAVLGAGILDGSSEEDEEEEDDEANKNKQRGACANRKVSEKFNIADFVILTSEQFSKTPVLWQIDGKSILQKYEPFMEAGNLFYRSKQMFTTWRSNSMEFYTKVEVRKCFQNGDEKVVKLILSPAQIANAEFTDKIMNEYVQYSDQFRVYVQALISQSLHNDFLSDVGDDDDFFHPNIAVIDHNIVQCRQKVNTALKWPMKIVGAIETWPIYRIISEMEMDKYQCAICRESAGITFSLSGEIYDSKTMKPAQFYPQAASYNKNITMCHKCITHAESLHKIVHEKFNLLQLCSKRVQDLLENAKDPHEILRELLTDSAWIAELFTNVRTHWTEAHNIERLSQLNELMGMLPQLQ